MVDFNDILYLYFDDLGDNVLNKVLEDEEVVSKLDEISDLINMKYEAIENS